MPVHLVLALVLHDAPITLQFRPKLGANMTFSSKGIVNDRPAVWTHQGMRIVSVANGIYKVEIIHYGGQSGVPGSKTSSQMADVNLAGNEIEPVPSIKRQISQITVRGGIATSRNFSFQFPSKPVKVGSTWEYNEDLGATMTKNRKISDPKGANDLHYNEYIYKGYVKERFKLEKIESQTVTISCQFTRKIDTIYIEHKGQTKAPPVTNPTFPEFGTISYVLDRATGVLISSTGISTGKAIDFKTKKPFTFKVTNVTKRV